MFTALQDHIERHGHARLISPYHERELGAWAANQRHKYHAGTLKDERRQRLESLPGWDWQRRPGRAGMPLGTVEGMTG